MKDAIVFVKKIWTWPCPECGYFHEEDDDPSENILICKDCGTRFKARIDRLSANDLNCIAEASKQPVIH